MTTIKLDLQILIEKEGKTEKPIKWPDIILTCDQVLLSAYL